MVSSFPYFEPLVPGHLVSWNYFHCGTPAPAPDPASTTSTGLIAIASVDSGDAAGPYIMSLKILLILSFVVEEIGVWPPESADSNKSLISIPFFSDLSNNISRKPSGLSPFRAK